MERQREIPRDGLDQIADGAIEDLRMCGLDDEEIFSIIEEKFGPQFAHKLLRKA
jgi:hypothetical protein